MQNQLMLRVVATIKPRNIVIHLREALANLGRGGFQKMIQGRNGRLIGEPITRLRETHGFGSNPGNLRMMRYLPPALAERPRARCRVAWMHPKAARKGL
jgi:hypothetical protein